MTLWTNAMTEETQAPRLIEIADQEDDDAIAFVAEGEGNALGAEVAEAIAAAHGVAEAVRRGETPEGVILHRPPRLTPEQIRAIRARSRLTQTGFADRYGFSAAAVRDWEQGRRTPQGAARTLMLLIDRHPEAVENVLAEVAD